MRKKEIIAYDEWLEQNRSELQVAFCDTLEVEFAEWCNAIYDTQV